MHKTDGCWEWQAAADRQGYGFFWIAGEQRRAHRLSYGDENGTSLTEAQMVCHTCDNPRCVRPSHLFLGDAGVNARDRHVKGRSKNLFSADVNPRKTRRVA